MKRYMNRFQRLFEIEEIERIEIYEDVDLLKVVEVGGVVCLVDMNDFEFQEQHE